MKKRRNSKKYRLLIIVLVVVCVAILVIFFSSILNKPFSLLSRASCSLENQCILKSDCLNLGEMKKIDKLNYCCAISSLTKKPRILISETSCLSKDTQPRSEPIIPFLTSTPLETNKEYILTVNLKCKNKKSDENRSLSDSSKYRFWFIVGEFFEKDGLLERNEFVDLTQQSVSRTFYLPLQSMKNDYVIAYLFQLVEGSTFSPFYDRYEGISVISTNIGTVLQGFGPPQISFETKKLTSGSYYINYQISDDFCKL